MSAIQVNVEFGGGLELLFANKRTHSLSLPSSVPADNSIAPSVPPLPESTSQSSGARSEVGLSMPRAEAQTKSLDLEYLLFYLRHTILTERPELFMNGKTVRPGILVLVNDTDWELEGEGTYQIQNKDTIVFISTLHGG